jgi:tetratricopeptide (TPR) repeat protein
MRATVYMDLEQWDNAIADLRRAIELEPNSSSPYHILALLLAYRDDEAGYQALGEQVVERFSKSSRSDSPSGNALLAFSCLVRADYVKDPKPLLAMLESAQQAGELNGASIRTVEVYQVAYSWLEIQKGQCAAARERLERSIKRFPPPENGVAYAETSTAQAALAMALIGEGKRAEAGSLLKSARATLSTKPGDERSGGASYVLALVLLDAAERDLGVSKQGLKADGT